jgi:hypothetical protein
VTDIRSVVLVGLFSAKDRTYQTQLDALEARVTALGAHVLERFVQRRGVSDGGVRLMTAPLSRRFLIRPEKWTRSPQPAPATTSTPSSSSTT